MTEYINETELEHILIAIKEPTEIEMYVDIWTKLRRGIS